MENTATLSDDNNESEDQDDQSYHFDDDAIVDALNHRKTQ